MERFIYRNKNRITLLSGVLVAVGLLNHFLLKLPGVTTWVFIIASIVGLVPIALQAYGALRVKVVSIDVLVTIAIVGAFLIRNYEESAIVSFLFLFGGYLEQRTLNKTRSEIKALTELAPETAWKRVDDGAVEGFGAEDTSAEGSNVDEMTYAESSYAEGTYAEVDIDEVEVGDILLVKTGGKIPVDGSVVSGSGYVNEASITGESTYVEKGAGAGVYAGTILENGTLYIKASQIGEDTTFGKIMELVEEAQDSKSEAERFIDSFARYYTPITLLLALLVYVFSRSVELAITVLVLGCPGALVIGVPVSNVAGIGNGAKHGALLKGSELIRNFAATDTFIFDKTGTLTVGKPQVVEAVFFGQAVGGPAGVAEGPVGMTGLEPAGATGLVPAGLPAEPAGGPGLDETTLKDLLVSVERESDHPLATAIVEAWGSEEDRTLYPLQSTNVVKGGGIEAEVQDREVLLGKLGFLERRGVSISDDVYDLAEGYERRGNSIIGMAVDGIFRAIIGIRDQIRPGVREDLERLKALGAKNLIILSGDNQGSVDLIKDELGLTEAYGNLLPEDKADFVKRMKDEGHTVAFVGDGINDSPSLALSDIAIAMGNGTDVAIEVSDVVLMNSDINRLPHAYGLAKATYRNMIQNIVIAVGTVIFLLASLIFSDWMNMSIGMFVHEASILAVILNGMRLMNYRLRRG